MPCRWPKASTLTSDQAKPAGSLRRRRLPAVLLGLYLLLFAALAIAPRDRTNWLHESILPVLFVALVVATYRRFQFTDASYVLFFAFVGLHTVAAHYGYSHVPIDWEGMGFERNHTDRVQHALFGLLMTWPCRDILVRQTGIRSGFWPLYLPFAMVLSFSALYEVLEWLAVVYEGDAGREFLGSQGDPFDPYKDMALAAATSLLVTVGIGLAGLSRRRYSSSADEPGTSQ